MIGTDENRAVLHVEVIFWSGKRKAPPSLVSGKYSVYLMNRHWGMPSPSTRILWTTARWNTMRNS